MNTISLTRCAIAVTLLVAGASTAHAQQAFEDKYVAARPSGGELVPLPTVGIVPVGTLPIDADVGTQLAEAVQKQMAAGGDDRFEVLSRPNGSKVNWAFAVRNAPRAAHEAFTPQFTDQLITCLHSLEDDVELGSLNILLVGGTLSDQQARDEANAAGALMLTNWKADRCATRRNSLPFIESNRANLTAATHGLVTEAFDPLVFRGQGLLDLISALYPVYFDSGGFWTSELVPRLHAVFELGVNAGLLTSTERSKLDRALRTFWDFAILVVSSKLGIVRSFIATTALGCVKTVPELSRPFELERCVAEGKVALVALRVAGQDYIAAQRVQP